MDARKAGHAPGRQGGRLYVLLDTEPTTKPTDRTSELIDELRDRVQSLEDQLGSERQAHAEARRIIAGLVERLPAIEAPQDAEEQQGRGSPTSRPRRSGGDTAPLVAKGVRQLGILALYDWSDSRKNFSWLPSTFVMSTSLVTASSYWSLWWKGGPK